MGIWKGIVWLVGRNTGPGSRYLYGADHAATRGLMAQAALQAWRDYQDARQADARWRSDGTQGHDTQYDDGEIRVRVVNGYSRDYDQYTTDIKVSHLDPAITQHLHVVYGEHGQEIMNEWRDDHR